MRKSNHVCDKKLTEEYKKKYPLFFETTLVDPKSVTQEDEDYLQIINYLEEIRGKEERYLEIKDMLLDGFKYRKAYDSLAAKGEGDFFTKEQLEEELNKEALLQMESVRRGYNLDRIRAISRNIEKVKSKQADEKHQLCSGDDTVQESMMNRIKKTASALSKRLSTSHP